jgi:hypothetical protein
MTAIRATAGIRAGWSNAIALNFDQRATGVVYVGDLQLSN